MFMSHQLEDTNLEISMKDDRLFVKLKGDSLVKKSHITLGMEKDFQEGYTLLIT